jgi:DnaJ-class molecular chaperone
MTADQINSQSLVDAARDALKCMERWSGVCNTDDYFGTMQRLRIALDGEQWCHVCKGTGTLLDQPCGFCGGVKDA